MKKSIVITTLIATSVLALPKASAEPSKEQNIGFASGAITGAAVGGPVGFFVGAIAGALLGKEVEKANQLDDAQIALTAIEQDNARLQQEMAMIEENSGFEQTKYADVQWMTEGLTMNVLFTTNSSELSDADLDAIERLAKVLREFPELSLKLDGYADPRGSDEDNLALSQARVTTVKQAFELQGIDADRVNGQAHGEMASIGMQNNTDAFALARKVSVNFTTETTSRVAQN